MKNMMFSLLVVICSILTSSCAKNIVISEITSDPSGANIIYKEANGNTKSWGNLSTPENIVTNDSIKYIAIQWPDGSVSEWKVPLTGKMHFEKNEQNNHIVVNSSLKTNSSPSATKKLTIKFAEKRPLSSNSIAVIIGNRNYQKNTPIVDFAHNDADLMKRYVVESLGYREGNVIDLRDATQSSLISTFGTKENPRGKLYDWIRPKESDIFIFYSGHGAPSLTDGKGYLLPVDADPQRIDLTGYPLETLYTNLAQIPAKSVTVIIDACFSGSSQGGSLVKNASAISLKRVEPDTRIPNATIITAAGLSEVASWDEEAGHGLFTRYFMEGVSGKADTGNYGNNDGKVSLGEMKTYLETEVSYMARRLYGREQHPQISGNQDREMARLH